MATSEERLKVLKMVQDGKITAEMAAELLKALDSSTRKAEVEDRSTMGISGKGGGRYFRVRVTDTDTGRARVNIRCQLHDQCRNSNGHALFTEMKARCARMRKHRFCETERS
jgi:DUF4097 and DUF4098 domain-containing protein YvlB